MVAPLKRKKVVVVGASGLVGLAAVRHFAGLGDWEVVGLSRRIPGEIPGATLLSVDLTDPRHCAKVAAELGDATHLVYAALYEKPGLVPARERWPRHPHQNFYFLQEDYLQDKQSGRPWSWTIFRPQVIFGESLGSPMNLIPAIGVYAALLREAGCPLWYPGGAASVSEAVDADLLARALAWAATSAAAANETFNITNGDTFSWPDVWPAIADAIGMEPGENRPLCLSVEMPKRSVEWAAIVDKHQLRSPRAMAEFVGESFIYADALFGYGRDTPRFPQLVSTIKIRQAGFADCIDTEDMFQKWFGRFRREGLLPA